jgi:virginiamycin B lyase
VRSHAKASSAGSNSGRGASLGSVIATLALAFAATACLLPGSAFAAETRALSESFGTGGTNASSFSSPAPLAFDQGNKHLYVFEQGTNEVHGFDSSTPATHTPLGGSFPLSVAGGGEVPDLAVNSTSHNFYYDAEGAESVFGFDAGGAALNFPLEGFGYPCGDAVDASGNVWVGEYEGTKVKEFDSAGNPIGSVDTSAQGNPCHVALDSEDNLYVSFYFGPIWKYTAASGYASATKVDSVSAGSIFVPATPIAVDRSTDRLYAAHLGQVSVFDPDGTFAYEFGGTVSGAEFSGIAIDEAAEEVYLSDLGNGKVQVFGAPIPLPSISAEDADGVTTTLATLHATVNPKGKQMSGCHFEFVPASQFSTDEYESVTAAEEAPCVPAAASIPPDSANHAVKADLSSLNPNTTYHFRLLASTAEGTSDGADRILTTATGAPTISEQKVEAAGTADATLSAKINPKGAKTTYHVEYGTTAAYGQSSAESAPIGFASDNTSHTISVHVGGLEVGTAYHFRFVATSIVGKAEGADTAFATYPATPASGPCSNDSFRTGFGARLPDCRAYEQVSPVDKHGANAQGKTGVLQASSSGDRVTFYLTGGLPTTGGSSLLTPYMASRGPNGWSTDGLIPLLEPGHLALIAGWSEDLATVLDSGEAPAGVDLYLRDSDAAYQTFLTGGPQNLLSSLNRVSFAADTSHLTFEAFGALLPGAAAGKENLYELNHGTLTLPGRIPVAPATSCDDESGPACMPPPGGAFAGGGETAYASHNTLSRDGSKVFFVTRTAEQFYVREDATRTTQISATQKTNGSGLGGSDPLGPKPAKFLEATPDGAHAFFTSPEELTDDANTGLDPAVGRANLDGTGANQSFIPVPAAASGVAVDGSHVYWANPAAGTIGRANLDGTGVNESFIAGASKPQYVAVDGSHVYWTNAATSVDGAGSIGRANLDGTSPNQSFITGASNPQGIAVDGSFVYWANAGSTEATRSIGRANLDGTSPSQSFVALGGSAGPTGLAVNTSFIYWANPGSGIQFTGSIEKVTLAGASRQVVGENLDDPRGLALDGSYLYWADNNTSLFRPAIGRVKLNGTERDRRFIPTPVVGGVAVDGAHVYWGGGDGRDSGNDLYSYDSASGELTDLSVDASVDDPNGANVKGFLGATPDGSYVYFVADGVLALGASPGGCADGTNVKCTTNLYVTHAGATTFIARLDPTQDAADWLSVSEKTVRIAGDGTLVFASRSYVDLSGHDHGSDCEGSGGAPCTEFYRYTPASEELNCITCASTGTPPGVNVGLGGSTGVFLSSPPNSPILPRNLSADGKRFFFQTRDALLPTDTNGVGDVYEWEAKGSGSCESESLDHGCIYLISSGTSPDPSLFDDASANGDHVFFFTGQQLVPGDHDELLDVYDAGVGAGLAPQHTLAPPTCSSTACQANPAPPPEQGTASSSFQGPGNAREGSKARGCPKGKRKVRHAGEVRCQKAHKQHKRHDNRGGSK